MWRRHHVRVCSSKIKESRRMRISHARSSQERQITPHPPTPITWKIDLKLNHMAIAIYHQQKNSLDNE